MYLRPQNLQIISLNIDPESKMSLILWECSLQIGASTSANSSNSSVALAAEAASKQQLETLQMQMLMQQTLLQQSLLGFNPYALAGSTSGTSSASAKPDDLLNPLLMASLMTNPLAMQSLLMDPAALAALSLAGTGAAGSANLVSGSGKKPKSHNSQS
ncbi:unnamed protein product [Angiostrongylus costaricensis]|uniref:RPN13_C domain-containing protein n=1 Tax=Angiostrongylus costaricensis TaxID=334426 RepID=A0A0R3PJT1_ANGCS|nr:unnamed protein product [Angiostrongylus costaricensis]